MPIRTRRVAFLAALSTLITLSTLSITGCATNPDATPAQDSTSAATSSTTTTSLPPIPYPDRNPLAEALRPVPETAVFTMPGYSLWDPSVIKVGDTYHLFCSRWPHPEGLDLEVARHAWKQSHLIRATAPSLFGPYTFAEVVMRPEDHPWATGGLHNPKITKVGDRFLLYHLGIPGYKGGFAYADAIEGPWQPLDHPVLPTNNPSLLVRDDGSAYVVGKFKLPSTDQPGKKDNFMDAYHADHVDGPYTRIGPEHSNRLPGDMELEDPCVWWANGQYNVICNDWDSKATGHYKALTLYTSKDGEHYQLYSPVPIWVRTEPIPLANGQTLSAARLERPQVYLNENNEVVAILAGVSREKYSHDTIIIRPVEPFTPDN